MPIITAKIIADITSHGGILDIFPSTPETATATPRALITIEIIKLKITQVKPPISPIAPDSIRNISRIRFISQPKTFIIPISLVLS